MMRALGGSRFNCAICFSGTGVEGA
jgi:hypothetical protein